jgi:hypothetical protein
MKLAPETRLWVYETALDYLKNYDEKCDLPTGLCIILADILYEKEIGSIEGYKEAPWLGWGSKTFKAHFPEMASVTHNNNWDTEYRISILQEAITRLKQSIHGSTEEIQEETGRPGLE